MRTLISTLARFVLRRPAKIRCRADIWEAGTHELRRRTFGQRESGAFLLGTMGRTRTIKEFIFYDDIDPHALDSGIVIINGRRLGRLWQYCRESGHEVVADIHVHPYGYSQSPSDQANPIIPIGGHIALILPDFAEGDHRPGNFGVYEYRGGSNWKNLSAQWPTAMIIGEDR